MKVFDVWKDHHGRYTATPATTPLVDDSDAPYGFAYHEIRIAGENARDAINRAKREAKQ